MSDPKSIPLNVHVGRTRMRVGKCRVGQVVVYGKATVVPVMVLGERDVAHVLVLDMMTGIVKWMALDAEVRRALLRKA